ncbi:hypothetical protein X777_05957 [Ooceraea biroi]|uniref:Uncharacterized protein n=1 Tax=Ooceraea biroi TaxID=2015173 RepID=A0A026WDJ1_OOCBI|nr:hypothetical protein X777_05957 [Ooceraea biroi]
MTAFAPGGRLWTRRSGYSSYSLFLRLEPPYPLCPMDNPATERKIKSRAQPCSRSALGKGRASERGKREGEREGERARGDMYAGYVEQGEGPR